MVRTVEHKEKIGEAECPSCGKMLDVRVNRQQCVYTICSNIRRTNEKGKPVRCKFSMVYGPDHSRLMIEEFLAHEEVKPAKEEDEDGKSDNRPADKHDGKPEPQPGPVKPADNGRPRRGLLGTVLFGDE